MRPRRHDLNGQRVSLKAVDDLGDGVALVVGEGKGAVAFLGAILKEDAAVLGAQEITVFRKPDKRGRSGAWQRKKNPAVSPRDCGVKVWAWLPADLLGSPAFAALGVNARRVLDRLMQEHAQQGGQAEHGERLELAMAVGVLRIRWLRRPAHDPPGDDVVRYVAERVNGVA